MQKKVVLVDGNNLLFRSYYATAYSGKIMRNSKGLPTNALYGFATMINKIINEEEPEYMMVAFDVGKNFRKEQYSFYKEGREEVPEDLKIQMPIARDLLTKMGIKYLELAPYEADDIIGTVSKMADEDPNFYTLIVSSDKDLLQLISEETEMKLLKQSGFIRYNLKSFKEEWKIDPINIIDLKSLMGDSSDNIPGVKGIGEKGALKLLQEYKTLDNIYNNIDNIKGKTKEKLENDKDNAYISYELATIYREVPIDIDFNNFYYAGANQHDLTELYNELEFYSLIKTINIKKTKKIEENIKINYQIINDINELKLDKKVAFYLHLDSSNYNIASILGLGIATKNNVYVVKKDLVKEAISILKDYDLVTYDLKKTLVSLNTNFDAVDMMLITNLLGYPADDDITLLMNSLGSYGESTDIFETIAYRTKFILDNIEEFITKLNKTKELDVYKTIEYPLVKVLTNIEKNGFLFDSNKLSDMKNDILDKLDNLTKEIYELAGCDFNINSPKQLGEVLYEKLNISKGKKTLKGYKTDVTTLMKIRELHPIIDKILEYRNLTKILNTYIEGLCNVVLDDGKIHTIFTQTLTRTGRLSSRDPNLQNIPIKEEYGRLIRKAFLPEYDYILSADYSQIELRVLAHVTNCNSLIESFNNDEDIHTSVASDIYDVPFEEVTKKMRSSAKAVIFGIVYGISGFGLGENLHISSKEGRELIDKYYELYPEVKKYMDDIIESVYKNGYVETMFGRSRIINEIRDENYHVRQSGERMALNTPIQGTSADIMKLAMINVYKRLKKEKLESKMILQIHDEIVMDVKKEELDIVKKILKEEMESVVNLKVPLKVEIDYGTNWYDAK